MTNYRAGAAAAIYGLGIGKLANDTSIRPLFTPSRGGFRRWSPDLGALEATERQLALQRANPAPAVSFADHLPRPTFTRPPPQPTPTPTLSREQLQAHELSLAEAASAREPGWGRGLGNVNLTDRSRAIERFGEKATPENWLKELEAAKAEAAANPDALKGRGTIDLHEKAPPRTTPRNKLPPQQRAARPPDAKAPPPHATKTPAVKAPPSANATPAATKNNAPPKRQGNPGLAASRRHSPRVPTPRGGFGSAGLLALLGTGAGAGLAHLTRKDDD